jgi:hypothetical protein
VCLPNNKAVEVTKMTEKKWWVKFCQCGRWAQARPANDWWEKAPDEVEVTNEEFAELRRRSGRVRDWYIGNTLTRLINEHKCE